MAVEIVPAPLPRDHCPRPRIATLTVTIPLQPTLDHHPLDTGADIAVAQAASVHVIILRVAVIIVTIGNALKNIVRPSNRPKHRILLNRLTLARIP